MTPSRIISGGQTGADQGALFAARQLGIETGGHAPRGWRTDAGPAPWLAEFGLSETYSSAYPPRTRLNVMNSDRTLLFGDTSSKGAKLTLGFCRRLGRNTYVVVWHTGLPTPTDVEQFLAWLGKGPENCILNVAGNRESRQPGITDTVKEFLLIALGKSKHPEKTE